MTLWFHSCSSAILLDPLGCHNISHSLIVSPFSHPLQTQRGRRRPHNPIPRTAAFKEWQEYEEAVKKKYLNRALKFLKLKITLQQQNPSFSSDDDEDDLSCSRDNRFFLQLLEQPVRDWEVLDACLNADDMKLVGSTYKFLCHRGFLPNFGKYRKIGDFFNPIQLFC